MIDVIEDLYDFRQTYLMALINSIPIDMIKEIWRITPYIVPNSYQYIIILDDGTHLCTCLLLVSRGIICHYYFKLMVKNLNALFHVMMMLTSQFQNKSWKNLENISKKAFIGVSSQIYSDDSVL